MKKLIGTFFLLLMAGGLWAQTSDEAPPKDWFHLDPVENQVNGISTAKTYRELLKGKTSKTVVVAVIDSGVDIDHEDLKDVIWVNEDEIPGNGIDDDGNGFVDDIHGWNFIGGKEGNVDKDTYELTREYKRLREKYEGKKASDIPKKEREEFEYWESVKTDFEATYNRSNNQYQLFQRIEKDVRRYDQLFRAYLDVEEVTIDQIKSIQSNDAIIDLGRAMMVNLYEQIDGEPTLGEVVSELEMAVEEFGKDALYSYNPDFDPRNVIGDDYGNLSEKGYGNNDVKGEGSDYFHGTHVAGIIAAKRGNGLGIDGVADNVKIMAVRAVPDGDERDKDVANAIRYAVDNGAQIINMSFGKGYSPDKDYVYEAIEYAASKGVLLIHAAGNSAQDNDIENNFPNDKFGKKKDWPHWLEVGASSWGAADNFVGSFSNYGKKSVDVFAPGVAIYSTAPDEEYQDADGTSMASPVTAGVAAMLLSYFPDLSATELKDIIMKSSRQLDGLKVLKPGTLDEMVALEKLSVSGGIVNAYEAVKLAESMQIKSGK